MKTPLIVLVCDSITNSVFESQVLQPLIQHEAPYRSVIIISFEGVMPDEHTILKTRVAHQNISLVIFREIPFIDRLTGWRNALQVKRFLRTFPAYDMLVRGAYAGRIALHIPIKTGCSLTIQARGILAEEFAFTYRQTWSLFKQVYFWMLQRIECSTYRTANEHKIIIEAVSPALKEHLCKRCELDQQYVSVAHRDIPQPLTEKFKGIWRVAIRQELRINPANTVYCYNGSLKAWQHPHKVIEFFKEVRTKDADAFLLVLTQDTNGFKQLLEKHALPLNSYAIRSVPHPLVYRYLAACDAGLVFREQHVVNWTSRPTKVLEYQAAGLKVIHDNTIAWLNEQDIINATSRPAA